MDNISHFRVYHQSKHSVLLTIQSNSTLTIQLYITLAIQTCNTMQRKCNEILQPNHAVTLAIQTYSTLIIQIYNTIEIILDQYTNTNFPLSMCQGRITRWQTSYQETHFRMRRVISTVHE